MVASGVGEEIDPVLGNFHPVADADFLPHILMHFIRVGELSLGHSYLY